MAGQDYRKLIPAGSTLSMSGVGGDYIYLKFADRPIDVIVNGGRSGQSRVTMEPGDKYRPGAFDGMEIENPDQQNPAQVVFTIGEGDYNRQIVQGQIDVVPRIRTADGTTRNDNRHEISFGIVPRYPAEPIITAAGTAIKQVKPPIGEFGGIGDNLLQSFNDGLLNVVWRIGSSVYQRQIFDENLNLIAEDDPNLFESAINSVIFVPAFGGALWVRNNDATHSVYYVDAQNNKQALVSVDFETTMLSVVPEGFAVIFDLRYDTTARASGRFIEIYDLEGNFVREIKQADVFDYQGLPGNVQKAIYNPINQTWSLGFANTDYLAVYNANFTERLRNESNLSAFATVDSATASNVGLFVVFEDYLLGRVKRTGTELEQGMTLLQLDEKVEPFEANVYFTSEINPLVRIDAPGNSTVKTADVELENFNRTTIVKGETIKAALELYYRRKVTGNYLDHVYAAVLPSGQYAPPTIIQSNSGTLAADGFEDNIRVVFPGRVILTVDNDIEFA